LTRLVTLLEVLSISSAECERGFSQMNLYHTAPRNRLLTDSVSDLYWWWWGLMGPRWGTGMRPSMLLAGYSLGNMVLWTHHIGRLSSSLLCRKSTIYFSDD